MTGAIGSLGLNACARSVRSSSGITRDFPANAIPATFGINPWIGQVPLHIAQAKGFFREAGIEISTRTFTTNFESIPAFAAGQLQGCGAMPSSETVRMAAEGIDYRIIGIMDVSAGGDAILARNSISDIKDFEGKEIAVQKGGLGHFFLLQILDEVGLSGKDIKIIDTDPESAAAAYQAGSIEIAYTYSPFLEKANAAQTDGRIIYDSSKMPTAIIDLNLVSTEFAEANPQAVQGFLAGLFKAQEFLKTNPTEAYAIAAEPLGIQPNEVAAQLKGVRLPDLQTHLEMLNDPSNDLYLLKPMQAMTEFLKDQGQIKTVPDLSNFIDPQFVMALSRNN
jgi:NitT/TauT family transport system substrate-binding protein